MPDNIKELLQHSMPFMVAAAQTGDNKVNVTRILEAVIIAGIAGAGAWLLLIPELKTEFKHIAEDVQNVQDKVTIMQKEVKQIQIDVVRDRFSRTDFESWRKEHIGREHSDE